MIITQFPLYLTSAICHYPITSSYQLIISELTQFVFKSISSLCTSCSPSHHSHFPNSIIIHILLIMLILSISSFSHSLLGFQAAAFTAKVHSGLPRHEREELSLTKFPGTMILLLDHSSGSFPPIIFPGSNRAVAPGFSFSRTFPR